MGGRAGSCGCGQTAAIREIYSPVFPSGPPISLFSKML
jgi:hypothetical protein